ncbi:MAG: GntR family transcriptional regulator [Verrucomicrobia bacterium]|nr:GntR family transcriptional regulator [Verrucomicrobiota bacterium]
MKTCLHLRDQIMRDILQSNRFQVGTRLPTVQKLARRYAVSPTTVGKAIALLEAEGCINKRRGSGIYLAATAAAVQSLRVKRRLRVGCVIDNLGSPLAHRFLEGMERAARKTTCIVEMATTDRRLGEEQRQVQLMMENGVRGVVLCPTPYRQAEREYLAHEFLKFPIVVVDLYQPGMKRPHLVFDNYTAGREMTNHLLTEGRREIAFLKFDDMVPYRSVDDRVAGYQAALEDASLSFVSERVLSYDGRGPGTDGHRAALERFLALHPRPTALIVPDDLHGPVTISFLRSRGLRIPEDVIVAGFDHLQEPTWGESFPTTRPDFANLGARAVELLLQIVRGEKHGLSEIILPCPVHIPATIAPATACS